MEDTSYSVLTIFQTIFKLSKNRKNYDDAAIYLQGSGLYVESLRFKTPSVNQRNCFPNHKNVNLFENLSYALFCDSCPHPSTTGCFGLQEERRK